MEPFKVECTQGYGGHLIFMNRKMWDSRHKIMHKLV